MDEPLRILQAFLAPAVFVSAISLLILSVNVRLMGIVTRFRQYTHAKHHAIESGCLREADAYNAQIGSIERRAEMIRQCFLCALLALMGTIVSCLLLGLGLYWTDAAKCAVIIFIAALVSLLAAVFCYFREVTVALTSVRDEALDSRFMDLGSVTETGAQHATSMREPESEES